MNGKTNERINGLGNELTLSGASTLTGQQTRADLTGSPRPVSVKFAKSELTLSGASTLTGHASAAAAKDLTVSPRPVSVNMYKEVKKLRS
ncbi:hypothetical protein FACS189430_00920 [Bacteroidia bacterium]|nr:hypothetical protein FACS189430_00920 [Bacteroidia bacterium]